MPIVARALELIGQYLSSIDTGPIYTEALYEAAKHNSSGVIRLLFNSGIYFEKEGLSHAFDVACDFGHCTAVLCLIENDVRNLFGTEECDKGLEKAAMKGHSELVLYFIQRCSEHRNLTISEAAVTTASGNGFTDILRLLVERVKSNTSRHNILDRALNIAARNGHTEVAEFLIREGGDVNAVVEEESAPGDENRCQYVPMIEQPARRSNALQAAIRGFPSGSSLHHPTLGDSDWRMANATAQVATIQLLLEEGADVNELADRPAYPLSTAAAHFSERVVQ